MPMPIPGWQPNWQQALGWDQGRSRRIQLSTGISGLVLLFCGVVMQWWAGNNISDMSLGTFCEAFSGDNNVMGKDDWKNMKTQYYTYYNSDNNVLGMQEMAVTFFGARNMSTQKAAFIQIEQILYSDPSFWCRSLPGCPKGSTCAAGFITNVGPSPQSGVWEKRRVSTEPYWYLPANALQIASTKIRCYDKYVVYRDMLNEVFTDKTGKYVYDVASANYWTQEAIDKAANGALFACYGTKGSTGYILGLSPVLSSLACIVCFVSLFTCCPRSYTAALGKGLSVIAFSLILVGFWVIGFTSVREFLDSYIFCENLQEPLVKNGLYFDGTPCIDRDSAENRVTNPYVYWSGFTTGVYTGGGVLNIIATVLLLISIAKTIEDQQLRKFTTLDPSDEL